MTIIPRQITPQSRQTCLLSTQPGPPRPRLNSILLLPLLLLLPLPLLIFLRLPSPGTPRPIRSRPPSATATLLLRPRPPIRRASPQPVITTFSTPAIQTSRPRPSSTTSLRVRSRVHRLATANSPRLCSITNTAPSSPPTFKRRHFLATSGSNIPASSCHITTSTSQSRRRPRLPRRRCSTCPREELPGRRRPPLTRRPSRPSSPRLE